jgi:hypothetical protein
LNALLRCKGTQKFWNVDFGLWNIMIQFEKEKNTKESHFFLNDFFCKKETIFWCCKVSLAAPKK